MAETQDFQENIQPLLSDLNIKLRDIDERNRLTRERVLMLGKNFISSKQELDEELKEIKNENKDIKDEIEKMKKIINSLLIEFSKFVKKDEIYLIERMLKDFQPLQFMRKKDVEDLIDDKIKSKKQIKTSNNNE
ncbi:MAG: hypothetical protein WC548_04725 [Candidatus Pacearchaeota archaeon]